MKAIQPVNIWFNGQQIQASDLIVNSSNDNLSSCANFDYALVAYINNPMTGSETPPQVIETLTKGTLVMNGVDYIDWNNTPDINEAAYVWVADQLNLTLV